MPSRGIPHSICSLSPPTVFIRSREDPGRARVPGEEHLPSQPHVSRMLARELEHERVVADGDIELERVAVIADVAHDAGEHILSASALRRASEGYVLRTDQHHDRRSGA